MGRVLDRSLGSSMPVWDSTYPSSLIPHPFPLLRDHPPAAFAHAAILEFLAAATGARVVAADADAAIADRLGFGVGVGSGIGLLLAALELFGSAGGLRVRGARLDPRGADKIFVELLHLEDQARRLIADRRPHLLEELHSLAL